MRRILGMAVLATAALIAGCSDSKGGGSVSTVTFLGSSSSQASSPSTTLPATTTVGATPTTLAVAATTTSTLPVTTAAASSSPVETDVLPSNISHPTVPRDRTPSAEDPVIFATYQAAWDGYVWTASHPDDPRWEWIDMTIEPSNRKAWRRDIEDHWAQGQALNADVGVITKPRLDDRTPSRTYMFDCQTTGVYWVDTATGQPAAGQTTASRVELYYVAMARVDGKWLVAVASPTSASRTVTECGG